jgi:euchromatic histone-lysine N-methyltransferase
MYIPVKSGDNVKLLQLLSLGYSANQRFTEADGGTPLHVAASEGHSLTAHILIQAGSELDMLDDEQNSPLMLASIKGRTDVTRYLLQAGADLTLKGDDGMTCLHLATQSGHLECAHLIMNQTNLPRGFINMQDEGGWTPLVWACENKHETVIRLVAAAF